MHQTARKKVMSVKPIQIVQNALTVNYCKKYGMISDLWPTINSLKLNPRMVILKQVTN